jgi:shikimate dehydrogenase
VSDEQAAPSVIGLIGDPVAQSLSPAFQQRAFDELRLALRYELWHTPAAEFPERLERIRSGKALGANVTVPHKELAFRAVDAVSDVARRVGAVNTIARRDGRLYGDNTDAYGFSVPLRERGLPFEEVSAVVVGAGGAARGVVVALLDAGIAHVTVVNRTTERAIALARDMQHERASALGMDALHSVASEAGLLVNATALGWNSEMSPVTRAVMQAVPPGAIAYDLTYRDTPFLALARACGVDTIDGLPMLVHQGARSFELWTGLEAPVDVMWQAAVAARAERGG